MTDLTDRQFADAAAAMGVELAPEQLEQLWAYEGLLVQWSGRVRLVSSGDRRRVRQRHLLDCLAAVPHLPAGRGRLLDLGSGGGLPGVVLHIAAPGAETLLLESARMKVLFLRQVKETLGLEGLSVVQGRAESETVREEQGGRCDWVTVRAVGSLSEVWRLGAPLLGPSGRMLAYKGPGEAGAFRAEMGEAVDVEEIPVSVPGLGRARSLVVVRRAST
jgi:16S rRNA (guanine527-N7)-methyltransferase